MSKVSTCFDPHMYDACNRMRIGNRKSSNSRLIILWSHTRYLLEENLISFLLRKIIRGNLRASSRKS